MEVMVCNHSCHHCEHCSKCFSRREGLRRHMKVHRQPYERKKIDILKISEDRDENVFSKEGLNLQAFELGVKHRERMRDDEMQKHNNMLKLIKRKKTRIDELIEDIESMLKSCKPEIVN